MKIAEHYTAFINDSNENKNKNIQIRIITLVEKSHHLLNVLLSH